MATMRLQMVPAPRPDPRVFAALGDATRLLLLDRLRGGQPRSIAALSEGTAMTRQAVTKHLHVLAEAGLVRDERRGREHCWALEPAPLGAVADWAAEFVQGWNDRIDNLEAYLRETAPGAASPDNPGEKP
jgi:DNA-binding transcriptional ArsR family regulator